MHDFCCADKFSLKKETLGNSLKNGIKGYRYLTGESLAPSPTLTSLT